VQGLRGHHPLFEAEAIREAFDVVADEQEALRALRTGEI